MCPDDKPDAADFSGLPVRRTLWRAPLRIEAAQGGFVLASAIFLLVIMAALAAFMMHVGNASQMASAQDVQGARAIQAARLGIERGLYAVRQESQCPGGLLQNIPGLTGFTVSWSCVAYPFKEGSADGSNNKTIWQITATACTTAGTVCPSTTATELRSSDYVERQLVVVTEQ